MNCAGHVAHMGDKKCVQNYGRKTNMGESENDLEMQGGKKMKLN
jgi:hypothetical protein